MRTTRWAPAPVLFIIGTLLQVTISIPRRGREPWSVILCKFRDSDYEPRAAEWFQEWMVGRDNPDTIESFFSTVSNDVYTIKGSNVTGWLRLPWTRNDIWSMAQNDPLLQIPKEKPFALYDKAKQLCIQFAKENGYQLHKQKITVINQEQTAIYGKANGVLLTPKLIFSSVLAHEMVHSMNIGHSYSDRRVRVFPYSSTGEYDDRYDLMSTANAHMRPSTYGLAGPGLNGPHLDYLGWLPMNRIVYFGRDGRQNYTLRLSSLSSPHKSTNGWLLIAVPYDRDDPQNVYTVEYRTPTNNDQGIGQSGVVIHKVQKIGNHYYSFLVTHANHEYNELTLGTEWVQFLQVDLTGTFQYIRIRVERMFPRSHFADVKIISTFNPANCLSNEVRVNLRPNDLLFSSIRKKVNFVCMRSNHSATEADIQRQLRRQYFFEMRRTFGQNECEEGYEWRAIDPYDYVCVTAQRVDEIKSTKTDDGDQGETVSDKENIEKAKRKREVSDVCPGKLIKRSAFAGDDVCVNRDEYNKVWRENADNHLYMKNYMFFNGVDTLNP